MKLTVVIKQFFEWYLPRVKGVSTNTIKAYRDTFALFLAFASQYLSLKSHELEMEHFSSDLILSFLDYLEEQRHNKTSTRNMRLATFKSLARMIRLLYPDYKHSAEKLLYLPQKRTQKPLIGYLSYEEMLTLFKTVDIKTKEGFRDYTILHLLFDTGARASEVALLKTDDFDIQRKSIALLGKGKRYRLVEVWPRTAELLGLYLAKYRISPKPLYSKSLFINQRGEAFTRHGIYRICKKYLSCAFSAQRMSELNPVHSFRHSCAVHMLLNGASITEIKNRLGHVDIQSTMVYLHLSLSRKREIQKQFMEYARSPMECDPKITELIDWENKKDILTWLDSL
jgi:integrase/recombinase XerD